MTLSADDYAVPEKRALRIHDASAVRFAWDHVHATKGLTEDERKEARRRIKERAEQLGLSTDECVPRARLLIPARCQLGN